MDEVKVIEIKKSIFADNEKDADYTFLKERRRKLSTVYICS